MSGAQVAFPISELSNEALETLKIRIEGAREAIKRSRFSFLVSTIAALSILITLWNAYVSWDRRFAFQPLPNSPATRALVLRTLEQWADSQVITVPSLGIHIGVSDLAILGTVALLVCSIWLFFCMRRHNHGSGRLLLETQNDAQIERRRLIYHGLTSYLVFTTISDDHSAINSLAQQPSLGTARSAKVNPISSKLLRWSTVILFMLPAIASSAIVCFDVLSCYVLYGPFVAGNESVIHDVGSHYLIQFVVEDSIGLFLSLFTWHLCVKSLQYEDATACVLREYGNKIDLAVERELPVTVVSVDSRSCCGRGQLNVGGFVAAEAPDCNGTKQNLRCRLQRLHYQ